MSHPHYTPIRTTHNLSVYFQTNLDNSEETLGGNNKPILGATNQALPPSMLIDPTRRGQQQCLLLNHANLQAKSHHYARL